MINIAEYPLFVARGAGSAAYGIAIAAWAVGQVGGSRVARRLSSFKGERRGFITGWSATALTIGAVALIPVPAVMAVIFAFGGCGFSIASISSTLINQRGSDDAVRARVFGATAALQQVAMGLSILGGGILLSLSSPKTVFATAGVLGLIAAMSANAIPKSFDESALADHSETLAAQPALAGTRSGTRSP
jgi:MFS family permease